MKKSWWKKIDNAFKHLFSDLYGGVKMSREEIQIKVDRHTYRDVVSDETLILEPRETFDKGIVGYRPEERKLVYALSLLIHALVEDNDWEYEEAVEWLYYNTIRACQYGDFAPIILEDTFADE